LAIQIGTILTVFITIVSIIINYSTFFQEPYIIKTIANLVLPTYYKKIHFNKSYFFS